MKHRLWLILLLFGCSETPAANYSITGETASQLFANATRIDTDANTQFIAITCTFSEGFFCYYLPDPKAAAVAETFDPLIQTAEHRLEESVSDQLLKELDPKSVERAKNNTVLIKCQRADTAIQCTINGGTQAEPLGIR